MVSIKLYDTNLASPTLVDDLTFKLQQVKFSTKLHGGFSICSFRLKADLPEAWEWLTKRVFYRLVISDGNKTLWEGRIEDLELEIGFAGATAYGYYTNLSDIPYNTAYNANADVVIKAVLTAACAQISSDQSHIAATGGPAITSAADPSYLDIYPQEIVEKLAAFSDTTNNDKWYFTIWEGRVPYFFKRSVTAINWLTDLSSMSSFKLKHRAGDLWNSSYALYKAAGVLTRTANADNTASQSKYGLTRRYVVPDLGEVAAAAAQSARDGWLADHKDIWPKLEETVLSETAYDINGVPKPSAWIRAGDVIRIRDLVPVSSDAGAVTRDALRTFYIVETEYDVDAGQMRLVFDTESSSLDAILARKL